MILSLTGVNNPNGVESDDEDFPVTIPGDPKDEDMKDEIHDQPNPDGN